MVVGDVRGANRVRDFRRSHFWRLLETGTIFPAIVTGSVITTIGLTLIPVAIGNMVVMFKSNS